MNLKQCRLWLTVLAAVFMLGGTGVGVGLLSAQSNATDAAIEGYVRDASGATVSGANITAKNTATNIASQTTTDGEGYYRFPLLQVGNYDLRVLAEGFKEFNESGIQLAVGKNVRLDAKLEVGQVSEKITVTADDSALTLADTSTAATGDILSRKEVEDLPIPSRNAYNYHLLSPGVQGLTSATFGQHSVHLRRR